MKTKDKIIFTIIFLGILSFFLYKIKNILAPIVLSFAISYFLNPAVNYLDKKTKLPRSITTSITLAFFLAIFIALLILVIPSIYFQTIELINSTPQHVNNLMQIFYPKAEHYLGKFSINAGDHFTKIIQGSNLISNLDSITSKIIQKTIESTSFLINFLFLVFIVPLLVFYLLKDWNLMIKTIEQNLPKRWASQTKEVFSLIDKSLSSYARGQVYVCLILSIFYGSLLLILGLKNGLSIGLFTGLLSFVPYIGFSIGIIFSLLTAIFQWGLDYTQLTLIGVVFVIGQIMESNFLTPLLIGKKIGIHPLWIIFGIFFFGTLFGFLGILLSVPLTAIFSVITKYFLQQLKRKTRTYEQRH